MGRDGLCAVPPHHESSINQLFGNKTAKDLVSCYWWRTAIGGGLLKLADSSRVSPNPLANNYMQHSKVDFATIGRLNDGGISGAAAADGFNNGFRARKQSRFGRIVRLALWGTAITLLSVQRILAWDWATNRQTIPSVIVSSTVPGNGDLNPYGVAFVPKGFPITCSEPIQPRS